MLPSAGALIVLALIGLFNLMNEVRNSPQAAALSGFGKYLEIRIPRQLALEFCKNS